MFDFTRNVHITSLPRYIAWAARGRTTTIPVKLRNGAQFELRPRRFGQGGNNDFGVAYEVFVHDYYRSAIDRLGARKAHFAVDMGANVGLASLLFLHQFPECQILAFEPHPAHAAQARRNFLLSRVAQRVEVVEAAAGATTRRAIISDRGSGSTIGRGDAGISIQIEDAFPRLIGQKIDLLKMDIEGGEYELLSDNRFAELTVRVLCLEWHKRDDRDGEWCLRRLGDLGYKSQAYETQDETGMICAWKE